MSFELNLGALHDFAEGMGEMVVEAAAIMIRDEVVTQMEPGPPRTGRQYPIPGTDASYTASAPGEPPAVREGRYVASIKYTPAIRRGDFIVARAYTDLKVGGTGGQAELAEALGFSDGGEYVLGDLLERGTYKMAPRPHWLPGLVLVTPAIEQMLRNARRR